MLFSIITGPALSTRERKLTTCRELRYALAVFSPFFGNVARRSQATHGQLPRAVDDIGVLTERTVTVMMQGGHKRLRHTA